MATFVRTQEIEHEIGPSGRFALRVTSPDAELRAVHGGLARVRIQFELRAATESEADELFERVRFHDERGSGSLEITEPKRGDSGLSSIVRILGIGNAKMDDVSISAELPAGAEITYDGVSADLTATGFTGTQHYRTVSGDLVLGGLAGDVQVRGVSGDVSIRADEALTLGMNTVSGDISAFAPRFNELRLATVSGDVEIEGDLAGDRQHRVETVSGDLSLGVAGGLTLEVRGLSTDVDVSVPHRWEGSRDRRRYVIGDGATNLLFSSMSGDVSVGAGRRHGAQPVPPAPPAPPVPPVPAASPAPSAPSADEQLRILRALERGEIDIEEASARLAGRKTDA
jgi:hypothetical protein